MGPAYTAKELNNLLNDVSLMMRADLLSYGKAFNIRGVVEEHFSSNLECQSGGGRRKRKEEEEEKENYWRCHM